MKYYLNILLLLICVSANAQTNVVPKTPDVDSIFAPKLTGDFFFENTHCIGEQYFNKEWADGDILLSNGLLVTNKSLKYNGLVDELIWLNSSNFGKFRLDRSSVSEFWLKDISGLVSHFKRINVRDSSFTHQSDIFAEVKAEGNYSLYIQRKVIIVGSVNVKLENGLCSFDDLKNTPRYYIKHPSGQHSMLTKLRRRAFLKLFPENREAITKIIKENHLKVKVESDFVKLIELMNK